jgi:hypothetical protein
MKNSITAAVLAAFFALPLLTGCNKEKAADAPVAPESPTSPAALDKPAGPNAVAASNGPDNLTLPSASTEAASGAPASASVGTGAIEAKAGDVSVKLPN